MKWFGVSIRLFFIILGIMVVLAWQFTLRSAEMIEQGARQAVETTLVDTVQLLAISLEKNYTKNEGFDFNAFADTFNRADKNSLEAVIYGYHKTEFTLNAYVTDASGTVIYDTKKENVGVDFSKWNDVHLALQGKYGARSSVITEDAEEKMMVVALPLYHKQEIIGVVALTQPYSAYDFFGLDAIKHLRAFVLLYLSVGMLILGGLAWWLAYALRSITNYAEAMAENRQAKKPNFSDVYLRRLAQAVSKLRGEVDSKTEIEQYVYGLTHELKTPLTAIRAAGEFLSEDNLSEKERQKFSEQIMRSNIRLQRLIERLLELARLEKQHTLERKNTIPVKQLLNDLAQENHGVCLEKSLVLSIDAEVETHLYGDKLLITQALQNLLSNAIDFAEKGSTINIKAKEINREIVLSVENSGVNIPNYAFPRLSERFFSLPRPDSQIKSTGLGLSFVQQIMTLHRGSLRVKNTSTGVIAQLYFLDMANEIKKHDKING